MLHFADMKGFKPIQRCVYQLGHCALHNLMGIKTNLKILAGWRVLRVPLILNGIETHSKMYSPAGWRVSHAPLSACLLYSPEVKVGQ